MLRLLDFSSRGGPGQLSWYRPSWRWRAFNAEKSGGSLQLGDHRLVFDGWRGDWMGKKGWLFIDGDGEWWWNGNFYRSFMFFFSFWWFNGIVDRIGCDLLGLKGGEKTMVYQHGQSNMAGKTSMNIRWKNPSHVGLPASRVWIDVNEMSPYRTCHTEIHPQFGFGNQRKDDIIPIAFGFWQHIRVFKFCKTDVNPLVS